MTVKELIDKIEEKKKTEEWRAEDKIEIFGSFLTNIVVGDVIKITKGK